MVFEDSIPRGHTLKSRGLAPLEVQGLPPANTEKYYTPIGFFGFPPNEPKMD